MADNDEANEQGVELRPAPVLAVGIAGHRNIAQHEHIARAVSATLDALLQNLAHALRKTVHRDQAFFSDAEPVLRVIGMAAEGADLLGARSAQGVGAEITCVLPFDFDEYRKDFSSSVSRELARSVIATARATFVLPGCREEGPRAYERANTVILANIDLLIAVWDGERAKGRAGTGDVVQAALSRDIPVVVITPHVTAAAALLVVQGDEELEYPIATDLQHTPLTEDLGFLVSRVLSPPPGTTRRQGLVDLFAEQPKRRNFRGEYPLLLKLFRVTRNRKAAGVPVRSDEPDDAASQGDRMSREQAERVARSQRRADRIDDFAVHYGRLFRSSSASEFLLIIGAAFLSGTALIAFPSIVGVSIIGQVVANGLVLIDATIRDRQRWHERWLDYRLIAERLRHLRFLHPLGLGTGIDQASASYRRNDRSWAEWYVRRSARELGSPVGAMRAADLARAGRHLVDVQITEQLHYHRAAFRQLGLLERRLGLAASLALGATIMVAATFGVAAYLKAPTDAVAWKPLAILLLFILPATATAFNGVRANADLVRLSERSAATAAALARLRRIMASTSMTYDRLAIAAIRAAAIMGDELSEWRFVLESRRVRKKRGLGLRRRRRLRVR
jgi:hypothetical protein